MAKPSLVASQIGITVGGKALPAETFNLLVDAAVDQHSHLPHLFVLRFHDPDLKLLDSDLFQLNGKVEISAQSIDGKEVELIKGEITAIEPEFKEGMNAEIVVRGYDVAHRLYRTTNSTTYLNVKDSDLADKIAQKVGLKGEIEPTPTVYDHIYQNNQSDLHFLMQRAQRIGYECFVEDGKLHFHPPRNKAGEIKLIWGQELLSFSPHLTVAEQVDRVVVRGWDISKKAPIVGEAQKGKLYAEVGKEKTSTGAPWGKSLPAGKLVIVDQPVTSQEEARRLASAKLDELSGAFIEAEGSAFRRPEIRAGTTVHLDGLGKRFSGSYLVTSATHTYSASGLMTQFAVSGSRTGLLLEQITESGAANRSYGVVPAIVTNTDDPRNWGRVKVKYPWMSEEDESDWARVVSVGGGVQAGMYVMPAVNDEVMVAFVQGDFGQPIVLGGVWNGKNEIPGDARNASKGDKPKVRLWRSLTGHQIAIHDDKPNKIEIKTSKGHKVTLDDAEKKLEIKTTQGHQMLLDDAGKNITIKSQGGLEIKMDDNGREISITSSGTVKITGSQEVQVESSSAIKLTAQQIALSAKQISLG